jgi:hypothetical protein
LLWIALVLTTLPITLGGVRRRHGLRSLRLIVLCVLRIPILHDNDHNLSAMHVNVSCYHK